MISEVSIGQLARQSGSSIKQIRYYEAIGLLPKAGRTQAGHRRYTSVHLERMHFILRAKQMGFLIKQIKELIRLDLEDNNACKNIKEMAESQLAIVQEHLHKLRNLERLLKAAIKECNAEKNSENCPLILTLVR